MPWIFIDTSKPGSFRAGPLTEGNLPKTQEGRGKSVLTALAKKVPRASFQNMDGICVVAGPGSFSAVRTGVVLANLLSRLFKLPLVPVRTEDAEDLSSLRVKLEEGRFPTETYVAPLYDKEPNITLKSNA